MQFQQIILSIVFFIFGSQSHSAVIVSSFDARIFGQSTEAPNGLAYTGANLLVSYSSFTGKVHEFTLGGVESGSYDPPGIAPRDIAFDGTSVWYDDVFDNVVRQVDSAGVELSSFDSSWAGGAGLGLTWDGSHLWGVSATNDLIYELDTNGTIVSSFATPSPNMYGLAWDGANLWSAELIGSSGTTFYQITTTGIITSSFNVPGISRSDGLTHDGTYLYSTDPESDKVYQILAAVPLPGTLWLFGSAMFAGLGYLIRNRKGV